MELKIYCDKDTVLGEFDRPFYTKNDVAAMRYVSDLISANQIRNVKDKQLYSLGAFDTDTGAIISDVKFICNMADLIKGEDNA